MIQLSTILSVFYLVVFVYLIYEFVTAYTANVGTVAERLLLASKQSATLVWAKFTALISSGVGGASFVADAVNVPQVSDAIKVAVTPLTFAGVLILVTIGSYIARTRKASTDPVK